MRLTSVIRVGCFLGVLVFCRTSAADAGRALIGATRDEVLSRLGDPAGDIVAGSREVLVFSDQRVVLNAGRVTEIEAILPEPAPAPSPVEPAAGSTPAQPTSSSPAGNATVPTAAEASAPTATSAMPAAPAAAGGAMTAPAAATSTSTPSPSAPPVPKEPALVIKSIRPPEAFARDQARKAPAPAPHPSAVTPASRAPSTVPVPAPTPLVPPVVTAAPAKPSVVANAPTPAAPTTPAAVAPLAAPSSTADVTQPDTLAAPPKQRRVRPEQAVIPSATESIFTGRTYLIAGVIIIGGIGYLGWRRRNRQLMLAATAVSNSPFPTHAMFIGGARFTPELLAKLEWKRFEELVAAYYNKTGVVATRTKSGPAAPVHVRISWKGEQRPFALVQCLAQPAALIDAKPIQALCDVLATEDIRRGYVVTSGKFGIAARDLAEEKHVTLLSGDIFLEKLNALPDPVRAELMHDITKGDYTTPTCPKCDVKMAHPPGSPDSWHCPQCGAVLPQA